MDCSNDEHFGMELVFERGEFAPPKQQEHFAVVEWLRTHPILRDIFLKIPNGFTHVKKKIIFEDGKEKYISLESIQLRKMGIRPSVFDFFIPLSNKYYHGLWIELKRKKDALLSPEKIPWQKLMRKNYYAAECAYGKEHFVKIVEQYLHGYDGINRLE